MKVNLWILTLAAVFMLAGCEKVVINENISTRNFNYPVLKLKKDNPVIRIRIDGEHEQVVEQVQFKLSESALESLKTVRVYYTGQDSVFRPENLYGEAIPAKNMLRIDDWQTLSEGANYFWCAVELNDEADLDSKIAIDLHQVMLDQTKFTAHKQTGVQEFRLGVAVRQHRQDNVHTYRIPGLTTTAKGSLLGVYDARREGSRDLQGHMDIGLSRSTDGGKTWEDMRIVLDMGEWGGLPEKFNGVSDANILVDENTGRIYVAGLWMHGVITPEGEWIEGLTENSTYWNHQWRNKGSMPGLDVKETSQFLITYSDDDGLTWSKPINLTRMCKNPEWHLWAPAPGHGITLDDGTLVMPTQGRDKNGLPFSNITYSKDGGATWTTSNPAYTNTTENMAVQLSDGSIMLNMRNNRNRQEKGDKNGRAIATTTDLGETWTEHPTSCGALIGCVCMASIHKHHYTGPNGETKSVLLFSNPNSKYQRHKQTIKFSYDDGMTWPEEHWIELDEGKSRGYSCITSIDENTIGILYEGSGADLVFQRVKLMNNEQ